MSGLSQARRRAIEKGLDPLSVHPDTSRLKNARMKAKALGRERTINIAQWEQTLAYFASQCAYHGTGCLLMYTTIDHYIPLSRGGGSTQDNCFPSCTVCNERKDSAYGDELIELGFPGEAVTKIEDYRRTIHAVHE